VSKTRLSLLIPYAKPAGAYDVEQTSFSFKLIGDLLGDDQGQLAGRLARKAFLQIEGILLLEGPLFIWNLLEILYGIVQVKQAKLFEILLIHLIRLARSYYPREHSIVQMLDSLLTLWKTSHNGIMQQLHAFLEQGWLLNANMILNHLDTRLMLLYYRLVWDSVLIKLAQDKLRDTDKWFSLMIREVPLEAMTESVKHIYPAAEATPNHASFPPEDYDSLKSESINALRKRTKWDFLNPSSRFCAQSALIKIRMLDNTEDMQRKFCSEGDNEIRVGSPDSVRSKVPRLHARILAYVIKVLIAIDADRQGSNATTIKRLNNIIALRGYAQGEGDPQVLYEMLRLQRLLMQECKLQEAAQIKHEVQTRLEIYLHDI
jgi:hypothetical protein